MSQLPRRIAFLITELDDGGAERAFVRIATGLDPTRWQVAVYCLSRRGPLAEPLEQAGLEVNCLGLTQSTSSVFLKLWQAWRAVRRLNDFFCDQPPVLLQTFLFHANVIGRLAANAAKVPLIVSGIRVAERRSRMRLTFDRATQASVAKHVCVSQAVAKFSIDESGLDEQKVVVIPNGVEFTRFQAAIPADLTEFGIPIGSQVILSVGRLEDQKDPRSLLLAFQQVAAEFPNAHLLFVGDGHLKSELQGQAGTMQLAERVHFPGRRHDVAEIMRASAVFALSSQWEGMPNVILEAAAAGLPIVATAVEGVPEIIGSEELGIVVRPGSSSALATGLRATLNDPLAAAERAAQLQQRVATYSWESVIAQYDQLYESFLASVPDRKKAAP